MFTDETRQLIDKNFMEAVPLIKKAKAEVTGWIGGLTEDEQVLMKLLYASMPISDIADYDFKTYLSFVDHALFLKKNIPWCSTMPDDIFINYVLFYRINNENIEDCRRLFYDSLYSRIAGKTMTDAALEANYWCAENVVYRSTDVRTASPLTVWRTGSGRCGEESTFTVTAMRSVGIPARQVYTPRWSHCDDNHAWVEVWCDGKWHYMGACEPEPVLDRGWFTEAASRAMFIHTRVFTPFIANEEIVGKQGKALVLNLLKNYAEVRPFDVNVIDDNGEPVAEAAVQFEVLNQSEFFPVATKNTDEYGKAKITMGLADIHIHVRKNGCFAESFANTARVNQINIKLSEAAVNESGVRDFKIIVPEGDNNRRIQLTAEQTGQKKQKVALADKIREVKIAGFYREQEANEAVAKYACKEELKSILLKARGNFEEVKKYLNKAAGSGNLHMHVQLLQSLSDKDFCDLKSEILLDHYIGSLPYKDKYQEDIFAKYVMCPRIYFERLTPYREFISGYFDEKVKKGFLHNPQLIWSYITNEIQTKEELEYDELFTSPQGVLEAGYGSLLSKRILFAAICRTIGIPARINPVTLFSEYYESGEFVQVEKAAECAAKLIIHSIDGTKWLYMQNWSVGILENGAYHTLDLTGAVWQNGDLTAELPAGSYRLLVSNRMPNGNLLTREYRFVCSRNQTTEVSIALPEAQIADMLDNIPFPDFRLSDEFGNAFMEKELIKGIPTVIIWLEEGKEPTEHILNELIEHHKEFIAADAHIIFVLRDKNALLNATLKKALSLKMNILLYYGDFVEDAAAVAKSLYRDSDKLPLVLVTCDGANALYSFSGYNVGIADILIKIIRASIASLKNITGDSYIH